MIRSWCCLPFSVPSHELINKEYCNLCEKSKSGSYFFSKLLYILLTMEDDNFLHCCQNFLTMNQAVNWDPKTCSFGKNNFYFMESEDKPYAICVCVYILVH